MRVRPPGPDQEAGKHGSGTAGRGRMLNLEGNVWSLKEHVTF